MKLIFTPEKNSNRLREIYSTAFETATELFIVSAYLTEWDTDLKLNESCKHFKLIVGKDFGITKKSACKNVMKWLPSGKKRNFLIADEIDGFHPKAVFWKNEEGGCYSLVGSSNLTKAAFEKNYEANVFGIIPKTEYQMAKKWIKSIEEKTIIASEAWLDSYQEGINTPNTKSRKTRQVFDIKIPNPKGSINQIKTRRKQLDCHSEVKAGLLSLIDKCANGNITSIKFYGSLSDYWGYNVGNRLQGLGFEISGKHSDFGEFSKSFKRIIESSPCDMDDTVAEEIDRLSDLQIPTRGALFSEFLCLTFPERYPIVNKPVKAFLSDIKFKAAKGSSEGDKYIDLSKKLRMGIKQNPKHPAKNLAELDAVILLKYGK